MNAKSRYSKTVLLLVGCLSVGLIVLNGCKKSEPQTSKTLTENKQEMAEHKEHATMTAEHAKKAVTESTEQTICPVMGNPIDKQYFTEYKGKKVYFCCPDCIEKFKANPEKYIAKLPQFKQ